MPDATAGAETTQANMNAVLAGLPLDLQSALKEAYGDRPEIENAVTGLSIAQRNLDLARKGNKPSLGIGAQYQFTPDSTGFSSVKKSWSLTAQVTVPIFDGGLTRARVNEAKADVNSARASVVTAKQAVALDVRGALLDLQEAMRQRQTTAANVVQAREAFRIAQVRFKAGVSTTVEVTDAQVALTQALNNQVNADYSFLTAEARLRKALGRLIPQDTKAAVEAKPGPPPADPTGPALPAKSGATTDTKTAPPSSNSPATPSGDQKTQ
jgi:outer membrane protein TolC